jgi:hypothetical protein
MHASFVDSGKAFDTVLHDGVNLELLQTGVGNNFYSIKNMYSKCRSHIQVENYFTKLSILNWVYDKEII